jgi:magnesium-transporting ATPase (P-type)
MNENNADRRHNDQPDWHAMKANDVLSALGVSDRGLSRQAAQERLDKHGPNKLPGEEKPSALRRFVRQFQNLYGRHARPMNRLSQNTCYGASSSSPY